MLGFQIQTSTQEIDILINGMATTTTIPRLQNWPPPLRQNSDLPPAFIEEKPLGRGLSVSETDVVLALLAVLS
ncbi:hypothetical protein Pcinc_043041 [Petrolisthes cinctipes]|uniref:Uncharacterized protein n=1 Tax=Petrolisthes cinctipes TaxID=88211 RepID=A0AAE1EI97_PETCI|nr:hypothetical protein Pcinc_043041 [Petrolisthes cinctipes]